MIEKGKRSINPMVRKSVGNDPLPRVTHQMEQLDRKFMPTHFGSLKNTIFIPIKIRVQDEYLFSGREKLTSFKRLNSVPGGR